MDFSKNKKSKIIILISIFIIITFLFVFGFSSKSKVIPGYISTNVRYISSDESGRVLDINVDEGQYVSKDTPLFSIDSANNQILLGSNDFLYQAALALKENFSKGKTEPYIAKTTTDLATAEAALETAKLEYERQEGLLEFASTSKREYEQAYSQYIKSQNQVKALNIMQTINNMPAREDLISAIDSMSKAIYSNSSYLENKINSANVKALEKGYIYQIFFHKGEMVRAYSPVMSMINPDDVYVVFFVSKEDLSKVHLSQKIEIKTTNNSIVSADIFYISQKAEYTPPLLYGINSDSEISFEVKARVKYSPEESTIHIGEPVRVTL